ncbi:hypothetical protein ACJ41O_000565 [Fusarium nematophilum]
MASPAQRTVWADLIEWSVEVDFLVAKEKVGVAYGAEAGTRNRWACPSHDPRPSEACVEHIAEHISHTLNLQPYALGGVAYKAEVATPGNYNYTIERLGRERPGMDPRMCYWFVSPAPNAVPQAESPDDYDWVGVRVRCPSRSLISILPKDRYGEENLASGRSSADPAGARPPTAKGSIELESVLGLIRAGVKIHTNSTCQLRVYMGLQRDGFDLTDAKKALTLAWLMEPELFLALRPQVRNPRIAHHLPITQASRIARAPTRFPTEGYSSLSPERCRQLLAQTRPRFPTDGDIMDSFIPVMNNSQVQERIQMIWAAPTLPELADKLKSADGGESAVALNVHRGNTHPTLEFRYGIWHPQRESMMYWLHLFGRLFLFAVASDAARFKSVVGRLEKHALEVQKHSRQDRWKTMLTYSFDNVMSHYWNAFKDAERPGGALSPESLDRQGILKPVPGVDYDGDTDAESSSSSSSESGGSGLWLRSP